MVIQPIPLPRSGAPARRPRRHRPEDRSWTATLERVLRSWPTTLRLALLLAILLAGLAVISAAGIVGPLLLIAGGHQARKWVRRDGKR